MNLAKANQALRGSRGSLFIVDDKLFNSQSGVGIPTRANLERDFFEYLFTNNKNNIETIVSNARVKNIPRFTSKTYNGRYGDYNFSQPSNLKLSKSILNRILGK